MEATFYFDPGCPWTWRASRWLLQAAAQRDVSVRWRPFSLGILSGGDVSEQFRERVTASSRALRLVAALAEDGREDDIARFYGEIGKRGHEAEQPFTLALIEEAVEAAGLAGDRAALDDRTRDAAVRRWHQEAFDSAGPDVGSPVLCIAGTPRGLHGPILAEVPSADESAALWDALLPLARSDVFYEIKRGRR
jgi:hypothetical protein